MATPEANPQRARLVSLKALQDWCMTRISMLSLSGEDENAQALTEEHMEILQRVDLTSILWARIEEQT